MPEEHGTLQAVGVFFACWAVVFFGVWVLPIDLIIKIVLDVATSIAVVLFGYSYFALKGKLPSPSRETSEKATFVLGIISVCLEVGASFAIAVLNWEVVTVNDVLVVTYRDLASFIFGLMGVCIIVFGIWWAWKNNPYRNKHVESKLKEGR